MLQKHASTLWNGQTSHRHPNVDAQFRYRDHLRRSCLHLLGPASSRASVMHPSLVEHGPVQVRARIVDRCPRRRPHRRDHRFRDNIGRICRPHQARSKPRQLRGILRVDLVPCQKFHTYRMPPSVVSGQEISNNFDQQVHRADRAATHLRQSDTTA
jgi:hypothetical protein